MATVCILSGCGIGLGIFPALSLSSNAALRKNECEIVSLSAFNVSGQRTVDAPSQVVLSASPAAKFYRSLDGCQSYDSAAELSSVDLGIDSEADKKALIGGVLQSFDQTTVGSLVRTTYSGTLD